MELLVITIILVSLVWLSLRFGYDSRSGPYAKEHEQAQLGLVWEVETAQHLADLRRDAAQWHAHRTASTPAAPHVLQRLRVSLAEALRALARKLSPEQVAAGYVLEAPQQAVSGC